MILGDLTVLEVLEGLAGCAQPRLVRVLELHLRPERLLLISRAPREDLARYVWPMSAMNQTQQKDCLRCLKLIEEVKWFLSQLKRRL